jgi:hypothetical protein
VLRRRSSARTENLHPCCMPDRAPERLFDYLVA